MAQGPASTVRSEGRSGGATVIGPILLGMSKSVQIAPLSASVSKILQMGTVAALESLIAEGVS